MIRDATVLTMDPKLGDLRDADVHVRNGTIVAVGRNLRAPGAMRVDGRGMIVTPGLIDTHWHLWNTISRAMATDTPERQYFPLMFQLAPHYTPTDMLRATRLSVADALSSGITTVHDWSHNIRSAEHADASLRALNETGIRARFSYGWAWGAAADETVDLGDLRRVDREWFKSGRAELLTLGLAGRGPGSATPEVRSREWWAARKLGIPISVHVGVFAPGDIQALGREGLLGSDIQLIHAITADEEDRRLIAKSGSSLSLSPWTETLVGFGFPQTDEMLDAGVPVSLSVDTAAISGTAEMFSVMRLMAAMARGVARDGVGLTTRRVLEMATIDGARGLGLDTKVGSLTPGKRADLILIRSRDLNIAPVTDPVAAVVLAASPANVDTVIVDGRILKRGGRLVALDAGRIAADAASSIAAIRARGGSPDLAGSAAVAAGSAAAAAGTRPGIPGCCAV